MNTNKQYKTVITYGSFDTFHYGHWNLLQRASSFGQKFIVGLSTDEFNLKKSKVSYLNYDKRKDIINSLDFVDLIIPEQTWEQKAHDIQEYNIDLFIIGDDWKGKFDNLKEYCEVLYLSRTPEISSTDMKNKILL